MYAPIPFFADPIAATNYLPGGFSRLLATTEELSNSVLPLKSCPGYRVLSWVKTAWPQRFHDPVIMAAGLLERSFKPYISVLSALEVDIYPT